MSVAVACKPATENRQKVIREYYNLKGLMDKQVELLDSIGPSLYKTATIDGVSDTITYTPDSSDWYRELEIFDEADLNKPRLSGLYEITDKNSPKSHEVIYVSKDPRSTLIDSLVVSTVSGNKKLMKIHAFYNTGNFFYSSSQQFRLNFTDLNGQLLLERFSITGWQKMILRDTTRYQIRAIIKLSDYPN